MIIKDRYPRTYRVKELDETLRRKRVRGEARILVEARECGIPTPRILDLDIENCILIMEYLPFPSLKEVLAGINDGMDNGEGKEEGGKDEQGKNQELYDKDQEPPESDREVGTMLKEVGRLVGVLHRNDMVHGDLTTSNILVETDENNSTKSTNHKIWFIDFGLAEKTTEVEGKGVDLHVFSEAFESTHSELMELLNDFYAGYREGNPKGGEDVLTRAREIGKRGRYS